MQLLPDEQEISGLTADGKWNLDAQSRIQQLISQHLQRLADTDGGWSVLYRDPQDGRYWELTYPHSYMHGGGPSRLAVISRSAAAEKYMTI